MLKFGNVGKLQRLIVTLAVDAIHLDTKTLKEGTPV